MLVAFPLHLSIRKTQNVTCVEMYPETEPKSYKELKHIAYVDDDVDDRNFFSEVLKEINSHISLSIFENGNELISFLRSTEDQNQLPCAVICDMHMPLMDGIDLLKLLKQEPAWQNIPFVIFTTSSNSRELQTSMELGATAFLPKPISFKELKTTISEIVNLCTETSGDI